MRKVIEASEGHILTNGKNFGRKIYLAEGDNGSEYYEISLEEYEQIKAEASEEATAEDYQSALRQLGVSI